MKFVGHGNVCIIYKGNYEKISFIGAVKKVAEQIGINIDVKEKNIKKDDNYIKYDKYYNMFLLFSACNG